MRGGAARGRLKARKGSRLQAPCLVAVLVFGAPALAAETPVKQPPAEVFRAIEIDGTVLAWYPWETSWVELKAGDRVLAGTLVQSLSRASIVVQREGVQGTQKDDDYLSFSFAVPTMLRIHSQLGRRVQISRVMLDARQGGLPTAKKAPKERGPESDLINAWRRVKSVGALLSQLASDSASILTSEKRDRPMELSRPGIKLVVSEPKDGAILVGDRYPLEIAIKWSAEAGKAQPRSVDAYVWPTGAERGEPAVSGGDAVLSVKIPKPGAYLLQLLSDEANADSPIYMITCE